MVDVDHCREELEDWLGGDTSKQLFVAAITELEQLRAALAALVDALPKCTAVVRDDEPTPIGVSGWKTYGNHTCGNPATHYELSAWGGECPCPDVETRCDEHDDGIDEADWATPLRAALRLLGRNV